MQERLAAWIGIAMARIRERSAREQALLAGAAFALLLVVLQLGIVGPLEASVEDARADAEKAEKDLREVARIAPDLQQLRAQVAEVEQKIQPRAQTNLLQLLEQLARESSVSYESIRPKTAATNDRYPETRAEVVLRGVSLPQTVQYLYKIETAPLHMIVRSLSITSKGDPAQGLDITFSVSSFQRS